MHGLFKFDYTIKAHPSVIRKLYRVSVPSLAEQVAIAQVISDMDAEIEGLEHKLIKYKMIKLGMMQELLTGKKRLP